MNYPCEAPTRRSMNALLFKHYMSARIPQAAILGINNQVFATFTSKRRRSRSNDYIGKLFCDFVTFPTYHMNRQLTSMRIKGRRLVDPNVFIGGSSASSLMAHRHRHLEQIINRGFKNYPNQFLGQVRQINTVACEITRFNFWAKA